jgi:4-amino-4-deoxy-L-arabinose transferase-like glycosyltransferase
VPPEDRRIAILLAGLTLLRLLLAALLPLSPQEAYYWTWSRDLALSYFDHPPLAAWTIRLTTALLGQTAFGIKAAAVLWSVVLNLVWLRIVIDMFGDRRLAFWSLVALNATVAYEVYGVVIAPDAPLIAAWAATIWAVWRVAQTGQARWWYAAGAFLGLACLAKYPAGLLAPVVLAFLVLSPRQRRWLATPHPWLACLVALAVFAPVLVWNAQHDWASFAFQSTRRAEGMGHWRPRYLGVLIVSQLLMATPYLLVVSIAALAKGWRRRREVLADDRWLLLLASGALPLAVFVAASLRSLVKMNWPAPVYWSLIILGVHAILRERGVDRRFAWGIASSAALFAAGAILIAIPNVPLGDANLWSGWREAGARVGRLQAELRAKGEESFVFSPSYKISAMLEFYVPGQPRVYSKDVFGRPALQFDFMPLEGSLKGATGILVTDDRRESELPLEELRPYFASVERVDSLEIRAFGRHTRRIDFYLGRDYRGYPRALRNTKNFAVR